MDVTAWMLWFLDCLGRAIDGAHVTLKTVLDKPRFWDRTKDAPLNDRQRAAINRLLDGFEGKLTSTKYAKLSKCSQDTAYRDILTLVERGVLVQNPEGGRTTSYSLAPLQ
jgi:Fic family protein